MSLEEKTLYRYRSASERNLSALLKDEIYFTSPLYFNDQNEFKMNVNRQELEQQIKNRLSMYSISLQQKIVALFKYHKFYDGIVVLGNTFKKLYEDGDISKEQFRTFSNIISKYLGNCDIVKKNSTLNKYFNELLESITSLVDYDSPLYEEILDIACSLFFLNKYTRNYVFITKFIVEYFKSFLYKAFYVCCLSEDFDNTVMWGNYANSCDGFVLGYNVDKIKKCSINEGGKNKSLKDYLNNNGFFDKVNYIEKNMNDHTDELFAFFCELININVLELTENNNLSIDNILTDKFFLKYKTWDYEKEYRIIKNSELPLVIKPRVIYLGNKLNNRNRKLIIEYALNNKIDCYEMNTDLFDQSLKYTFSRKF